MHIKKTNVEYELCCVCVCLGGGGGGGGGEVGERGGLKMATLASYPLYTTATPQMGRKLGDNSRAGEAFFSLLSLF